MKSGGDAKQKVQFISSRGQVFSEDTAVQELINQPYFVLKIDDLKEFNVICEKSFSYKNYKFNISVQEKPIYDNIK